MAPGTALWIRGRHLDRTADLGQEPGQRCGSGQEPRQRCCTQDSLAHQLLDSPVVGKFLKLDENGEPVDPRSWTMSSKDQTSTWTTGCITCELLEHSHRRKKMTEGKEMSHTAKQREEWRQTSGKKWKSEHGTAAFPDTQGKPNPGFYTQQKYISKAKAKSKLCPLYKPEIASRTLTYWGCWGDPSGRGKMRACRKEDLH